MLKITDKQLNYMAHRFQNWRTPKVYQEYKPTGAHFLSIQETKEMISYILEGLEKVEQTPPCDNDREAIYLAISIERDKQIKQWGGKEHDVQNNNRDWASYITKQVNFLDKGGHNNKFDHVGRLVKIAALAVAALEAIKIDNHIIEAEPAKPALITGPIRPAHYNNMPMPPIDFINVNNLNFNVGNVIKYVCRAEAKNGIEDLKKAKQYIDFEITRLEALPK